MKHAPAASLVSYQVCFQALGNTARALAFHCDDRGNVDLDSLSDKARADYLFARALVGRRFAPPAVVRVPRSVGLGPLPLRIAGGWHATLC